MYPHPAKAYAEGDNREHNEDVRSRASKVLLLSAQVSTHALRPITRVTPNNQEQHNLNSKADPIGYQHNTIDCPVHAREMQNACVSSCLGQQILEGCRRKIEQGQPIVANVVGIVCPDLPSRGLVLGVELVWRNREILAGVLGQFLDAALLRVFCQRHDRKSRVRGGHCITDKGGRSCSGH